MTHQPKSQLQSIIAHDAFGREFEIEEDLDNPARELLYYIDGIQLEHGIEDEDLSPDDQALFEHMLADPDEYQIEIWEGEPNIPTVFDDDDQTDTD
jgi:hypothetical protein